MADSTRRTTFHLLLAEVKQLVTKGLNLPDERIFRLMRRLGPSFNVLSSPYIAFRPGSASVDGMWHDSEGRLCVAVERDLIVQPFIRLSMDDVASNDRITQELLTLEDAIVDIIDIYEPENALEPIHFKGIDAETAGDDVKPASITPLWATSSLHFNVKFLQAVNQSRQ